MTGVSGPAIDLRVRPPAGAFLSLALFDEHSGLSSRLKQRGYSLPNSYLSRSVDALFEEMTEAGIDQAVIAARAGGRLGGVSNAEADRLVRTHPARFAGFIGQTGIDARAASRDLDECVELRALGVAIEPGLADPPRRADDVSLIPIYAMAAARDLPIFVTGGDSGPDTASASPLWLERASAQVPAAQFVAVHGGWPYVREMAAVALRRSNIWVMPDMYAARFPGHREYVEAANGLLQDRIVLGTSYPAVNIVEYVAALRDDGLTDDAWRAIAVRNPARLLSYARREPAARRE